MNFNKGSSVLAGFHACPPVLVKLESGDVGFCGGKYTDKLRPHNSSHGHVGRR